MGSIDVTRSAEDRALARALERHGFSRQPEQSGVLARTLDALPPPVAPPEYRLQEVRSTEEIMGRVEAHRLAFPPSELTFEKYQRVRRTWPYRPDLDRIALCEDGSVAAFCTAWLDADNGVGLLEPVGTHPAHRRRGLARAVCLDAFRVLRDAGARSVHVGFGTAAALATYESSGCRRLWADTVFRRPGSSGADLPD
jgi:GNAT superfamily N-acetyltransferase